LNFSKAFFLASFADFSRSPKLVSLYPLMFP